MKTTLKQMLALGMMVAAPAMAQEHVGNGGGSHYCSGRSFQEVYDVYEGKTRYGLKFDEKQTDESQIIQNALAKIKLSNVSLAAEVSFWISYLQQPGVFETNQNIKLTPIKDANILMTNEGCEYVQLANWDEETGKVFVKPSVYNLLPPFHKAALKLHEAIYKTLRARKSAKNSDESRKFNAYLLSESEVSKDLWASIQNNRDVLAVSPSAPKASLNTVLESDVGDRYETLSIHAGAIDLTHEQVEAVISGSISHPVDQVISDLEQKIQNLQNELGGKKIGRCRLKDEIEKLSGTLRDLKTFKETCWVSVIPESRKKFGLEVKYSDEIMQQNLMTGCYSAFGYGQFAKYLQQPLHVKVTAKLLHQGREISENTHEFDLNFRIPESSANLTLNTARRDYKVLLQLITQDRGM